MSSLADPPSYVSLHVEARDDHVRLEHRGHGKGWFQLTVEQALALAERLRLAAHKLAPPAQHPAATAAQAVERSRS